MQVDSNPQNAEISVIIAGLKHKPGSLLPILHGIQDELGFIPEEAVPVIATELNLTRAEVHGVISFYPDFRSQPPGRHIVKVCQAESCQAVGGAALTAFIKKHLGIDFRHTTPDNSFTLEPVYCLGSCSSSPALMLDGDVYGRVTPQRLREILKEAREAE